MTTDPSSLQATVRRLQDRVAILETLYGYCRHADQLDAESMAALFTEDCVAAFHDDGPTLRSRAELQTRLAERLAVTRSGSHHISNAELIFDAPDQVTAHAYMYSWQRFEGWPATSDVHRWGRYELRFARAAGRWLISHLRLFSAGEYGSHRIGEQLGKAWPPGFEPLGPSSWSAP